MAAGVRAYASERLSPESVDALLDPQVLHLDAPLERLTQWQVLVRWQEPARTGEDFLRRRDRYQLTPLAAPRAIHDRLAAFADAVRHATYSAAAAEFQQISTLHLAMATAARTWQRGLAHAMSGGPDPEKQELKWRTLQAYVGIWGEQVDVHSPRISELMGELTAVLSTQVWRGMRPIGDGRRRAGRDGAGAGESLGAHVGGARLLVSGGDGQARRLRRQLRDGVSSRVLTLNLPLTGTSPAAHLSTAAIGEPVWLTLRVLSGTWTMRAPVVFVCENPTVVESVADALGSTCPSLGVYGRHSVRRGNGTTRPSR